MALIPKTTILPDQTGESLFVFDKTGAYEEATNAGGYGDPNEDLAILALVAYGERIDEKGVATPLTPVSNQIIHNSSAANTDQTDFEFQYPGDGHVRAGFFALRVTSDGANYLGGGVVDEGDYYYQDGAVYHRTGGQSELVEDYSVMVDDPNVYQVICQDVFFARLSIEKGSLYQDYKNARNKGCIQEAEDLFEKIQLLQHDIMGADYDFRSGLLSEARKTIKSMTDEYLQNV